MMVSKNWLESACLVIKNHTTVKTKTQYRKGGFPFEMMSVGEPELGVFGVNNQLI